MLKYTNRKIVKCSDFDKLVESTYNRPYSFQQQDGCRERGLYRIDAPSSLQEYIEDEDLPSLEEWKEEEDRSNDSKYVSELLRWYRDYYPNIGELINDLLSKGLIEEGSYYIEIG